MSKLTILYKLNFIFSFIFMQTIEARAVISQRITKVALRTAKICNRIFSTGYADEHEFFDPNGINFF